MDYLVGMRAVLNMLEGKEANFPQREGSFSYAGVVGL